MASDQQSMGVWTASVAEEIGLIWPAFTDPEIHVLLNKLTPSLLNLFK